MKRRSVLAGSLAVGLGARSARAQDNSEETADDAVGIGVAVPDRATRRARIEVARRWEEEADGGDPSILAELASPEYTSTTEGNAPGVDALVERYWQALEAREEQYESYTKATVAFAVSGDSVSVRTVINAEANGRIAETYGFGWYTFGTDNLVVKAWGDDNEGDLVARLFA